MAFKKTVRRVVADERFDLAAVASLLSISGVSLIAPALPTFADALQVSQSSVGLLISAFIFPSILILPFTGYLTDRLGRNTVMFAGSMLMGAGGIIAFAAPVFPVIVASRVVQGIGFAALMPVTVALIGDLFEGNAETEAQGLRTSLNNIGGILWLLLGGAIAAYDWRMLFLVYTVFLPLGVLLYFRIPSSVTDTETESMHTYFKNLALLVETPSIALYLFIGFARFFIRYSLITYLPLVIVLRHGVGPEQVGVYMSFLAIGGAVSAAYVGAVTRRFDKLMIISASFVVSGAAIFSLFFSHQFYATVAVLAVVGMLDSWIGPSHKSLLTQSVDKGHRAGLITLNALSQNLAKTVAPLVLAVLILHGQEVWLLPVGAAGSLIGVLIHALKPQHESPALGRGNASRKI